MKYIFIFSGDSSSLPDSIAIISFVKFSNSISRIISNDFALCVKEKKNIKLKNISESFFNDHFCHQPVFLFLISFNDEFLLSGSFLFFVSLDLSAASFTFKDIFFFFLTIFFFFSFLA